MKSLLTLAALFALAVPAAFAVPPAGSGSAGASAAPPSGPTPSQLCKEQRQAMGAANFISTYAPGGNGRSALGRCISRQSSLASSAAANAAKWCNEQRASLGVATFNQTYGNNINDRNSFGKCVSKKAKELNAAQQDATLDAAKVCKAERASGAVAFKNKYGTNPTKSNAFGKCIKKMKSAATP